jgi:hypothetical protein
MPAEVRCTSSGALRIDGRASASTIVTAPMKPSRPAQITIQMPLLAIMPMTQTSASNPVVT